MTLTEKGALVRQFFAEDPAEEEELLCRYFEELKPHHLLLTYNGRQFDLPFLLKRAERRDVDIPPIPYHLDLYLVLHGYSSLRKFLPNLRQKTVEDFMGLWTARTDQISGAQSAALYQEYLYRKEICEPVNQYVETMLLHNSDDLLQLGRLLPALEKADLNRALFYMGFPLFRPDGTPGLIVERIDIRRTALTVAGRQISNPTEYVRYGEGASHIRFDRQRASFSVSLPLARRETLAILDLAGLPEEVREPLSHYPAFESDYLVLQSGDGINCTEINHFIKAFLEKILAEISGGIE